VIKHDQKADADPGTCLFFVCLQYYVKQHYWTIICISTTTQSYRRARFNIVP